MRVVVLFLSLFIFVHVYVTNAQESGVAVPEDFYKHFKGKSIEIDQKTNEKIELEVFCNMRRRGEKITGSFYNKVDEQFYYLEGEFKNSTQFVLEQYDYKFFLMGFFEGVFTAPDKAKGKWKSANDTRTFVFTLEEEYSNSVQFKNHTDTSVYHIQNKKSYPYCVLNFDYLNPAKYKNQVAVKPVSNEIQKRFFGNFNVGGNVEQSIVKKKNDLFVDYRNIVERQFKMTKKVKKNMPPAMMVMFNRKSKFTTSIYYNEDNILCLSKDSIEEAGGEAIAEGKSFYVFDMKSGRAINVDELFFYPKYKEMMTNMYIDKMKLWLGVSTLKELKQQGFDKEFIKYNKNFYVDRYGLGFYFNPYEVNESYVRVYFTWRELTPYLKEKSLVSHLFPKDLKFDQARELTPDDIIPVVEPEEGEEEEEIDDGFMPGIFLPGGDDGEVKFPDDEDSEEGGVVFPDDDDEGGVVFPDDDEDGKDKKKDDDDEK